MVISTRALFSAGVLAFGPLATAHAHHSVAGSFDATRSIGITGEVVEWRFRNPHTLLVVDGTAVIDSVRDDTKRRWEIESSAAAGLRASGVDEKTFVPGARITVKGIPHRNATTYRANAFGSSGGEPMSIPDIHNAPSYIVRIEIAGDRVVLSNQAYKVVRTVPLDGSEAPADPKQQFGIVRLRIDNGTLVVESRAYPPSAWGLGAATQIMGAGADVPSSREKTVVERFSVSPDGLVLTYEYTVRDPVYLAAPFSHSVRWAWLASDTTVYPYDCDVESASQFSRD